mmetsp:Transcript_13305/g.27283  ORF Transcript_13305/g.27283 Transcript_13305/m.27283 type:complete len:212 (-) Transcript_13305:1090-1725(-)
MLPLTPANSFFFPGRGSGTPNLDILRSVALKTGLDEEVLLLYEFSHLSSSNSSSSSSSTSSRLTLSSCSGTPPHPWSCTALLSNKDCTSVCFSVLLYCANKGFSTLSFSSTWLLRASCIWAFSAFSVLTTARCVYSFVFILTRSSSASCLLLSSCSSMSASCFAILRVRGSFLAFLRSSRSFTFCSVRACTCFLATVSDSSSTLCSSALAL